MTRTRLMSNHYSPKMLLSLDWYCSNSVKVFDTSESTVSFPYGKAWPKVWGGPHVYMEQSYCCFVLFGRTCFVIRDRQWVCSAPTCCELKVLEIWVPAVSVAFVQRIHLFDKKKIFFFQGWWNCLGPKLFPIVGKLFPTLSWRFHYY